MTKYEKDIIESLIKEGKWKSYLKSKK
jgi:hypothetical protein